MHIFVISLQTSVERRRRILDRLAALGLTAEIFWGIDGRKLPPSERRYAGRLRQLLYGKDLTDGEIGCAQSHFAVCAEIAARGLDRALVLEDDAILADHLPQVLEILSGDGPAQGDPDWDFVRFLGKPKNIKRRKVVADLGNGLTLCRFFGTPGTACGYVVTARAAGVLAECGRTLWTPVDILYGQVWLHRLRVRCIVPSPAIPDDDVASTIEDARFVKKRGLRGWERIVHPIVRMGFKIFDGAMKYATYYGGICLDRLTVRSRG